MEQVQEAQIYMTVKSMLAVLSKMRSDRLEAWSDKLKGISKMELHVLLLVQAKPDIVLGEVRDGLDVPNSTLTGVIDRMEEQGLARRRISARDRRSYGLELTEKGKEVRREHDRVLRTIATSMLSTLNEDERSTFTALLSKIADNMPSAIKSEGE
jgi:DNA-binding MarR family transcriptional regulator